MNIWIEDWRTVLKKAWSMKLALAATVMSAGDAGIQYFLTGQPPIIAIGAALFSLAAGISRLVAQPKMNCDG